MLLETTADSLTGIAAWAVGIMTALGGPGAALLIALENLFPPLPSEVFLPLAGFSAGTGSSSMTVLSAILWCTSGSVVGAWALYWGRGVAGTGANPPDPGQDALGQDIRHRPH